MRPGLLRCGVRVWMGVVLALVVVLLVGVPSAFAGSGWWHLSSRLVPSRVVSGSARDEVQEVKITAEEGEFFLFEPVGFKSAKFPVNVKAAELQTGLEGLYGADNVLVSGEKPFRVQFTGAKGSQHLEKMLGFGAEVSEAVEGRPDAKILLSAMNVGDASLSGEPVPVRIVDRLPVGLRAVAIEPVGGGVECSLGSLSCSSAATVPSYGELTVAVSVDAQPGASGLVNAATVEGANAPSVVVKRAVPTGSEPVAFGVEDFTMTPEEEGGEVDTRAGSHPVQLTNTLTFTSSGETFNPPALPRDLHLRLPVGLLGNATAVAQCDGAAFAHIQQGGEANQCPADSAIGVALVTASLLPGEETHFAVPLFNLTPAPGEPARFGFVVVQNPVIFDTALRSGPGEDYGVTVNVSNISETVSFLSATVTFWGSPDDPVHDEARGWGCLLGGKGSRLPCVNAPVAHPTAFLTLPTNCAAPFDPSVEGSSWPTKAAPEGFSFPAREYSLQDQLENPLSLAACNQLVFSPAIKAEPTADSASSPSGLDFNMNVNDEGLINGDGVAQSQLNRSEVVLPQGLTVNPSSGVGLGGCTRADYARETLESPPGEGCPNDSKLGTVEAVTPLLSHPLHGSLFIAQSYENPFGSLIALYIVIKDPETGTLVKLPGRVIPNAATGQLTTVIENVPQLPVSHFNFHFREGQQAPLITPPACGTFTTQALLSPWSDPAAPLTDTSSFAITSGAGGGPCPSGGVPFNPQIQAGTQNNNAGAFSPFYLRLTRSDADQEISGFSTNMPPGLTGDLTGIPFCPELDIQAARTKTGAQEEAEPSCPLASEVGHTLVGTGVGAVLAYVPGKLYLAGPYNGAPFSLVSVTSAKVGPFDLGTVVLRFALDINPYTAQVSVNPTASEPIPTIIKGIVTHVRDIRAYVDRPDFIINPTSCAPMTIGSTLTANEGASATISSPFQAASCANLKFAPKVTASTSGKTSKANGASLTFKLTYPAAPPGSQANLAKTKVDLPKALPSRLTTLQKACTSQQFNLNPAGCPKASIIGHARATTPLIPVPLEGPAIFVSHGGEAFPSLSFVLQGYGITIELTGQTFISKAGVTSTTFRAIPDQPVGTFELTLPQGPYSALAANVNLCKTKRLLMPTRLTAQNGTETSQNTKITVTGCKKPLKRKNARRRASGRPR